MIKPRRGDPDGRTLKMRPAGVAIAEALRDNHLADAIREERVVTEWHGLAGDRIAQRTRPLEIRDRVLVIEVVTSAWLHELTLMRPRLLADLLARVGEPRVFDDLKFVLAGRTRRQPAAPRRRTTLAPPTLTPATGAQRDAILKDVETIADPDLRALIADVRIKAGR